MEKEKAGGCGVVGGRGFPGRFQERVSTQSFLHRYTSPTTSSVLLDFHTEEYHYV